MLEIVPYKARWPREFDILKSQLQEVFGKKAVRIDHIGSTSVTGLAAKDIIDVMISVKNLDDVEAVVPALLAAGFDFKTQVTADHLPAGAPQKPGDWEKRLFGRKNPVPRVHLHVRRVGAANQRYALLFRDYLRANPLAAAAYADVKHQLAKYHGHTDDHIPYVEIKDPVCDLIMVAAEEWALRTGWEVK